MFNIPLSDESGGPTQQFPPMIHKVTGPGYPKEKLIANRKTRCEVCTHVVDPQFSWCELPCPRAGTAPVGWQTCIFCGTMRCDPLPVMLDAQSPDEPPMPPPPVQQCMCTYEKGKRFWEANQRVAEGRNERGSWCHQE